MHIDPLEWEWPRFSCSHVVRLQDCSIELTVGRRYGLIGQNGSGKTNFLQALAHREVRTRLNTSRQHGCNPLPLCHPFAIWLTGCIQHEGANAQQAVHDVTITPGSVK